MSINLKVLIVFLAINTAAFLRERAVKQHQAPAPTVVTDSTRADSTAKR